MLFLALAGLGGVGDDHPGQYLPFWEEACERGNVRACRTAAQMEGVYCGRGSGWACNERAVLMATRLDDPAEARADFQAACALGFTPGCENVIRMASGQDVFAQAPPPLEELPIVIRGSKGAVTERDPEALYALACERGWEYACGVEAPSAMNGGS